MPARRTLPRPGRRRPPSQRREPLRSSCRRPRLPPPRRRSTAGSAAMSAPSDSGVPPATLARKPVREPSPLSQALPGREFPADLEQEFREDYLVRSLVYLRWALALAFILNLVYGFLEIAA